MIAINPSPTNARREVNGLYREQGSILQSLPTVRNEISYRLKASLVAKNSQRFTDRVTFIMHLKYDSISHNISQIIQTTN